LKSRGEIALFRSAGAGPFDRLRVNPYDKLRTSPNPPKADFGWRLNLLLASHPAVSTKKAGNGCVPTTTCLSFLVRPAGFEPAAYGFEDQDS